MLFLVMELLNLNVEKKSRTVLCCLHRKALEEECLNTEKADVARPCGKLCLCSRRAAKWGNIEPPAYLSSLLSIQHKYDFSSFQSSILSAFPSPTIPPA